MDLLVNAAARFSAAIGRQLVLVENDPAPADFAEKTVAYAEAKVAYFTALRDEMPELRFLPTPPTISRWNLLKLTEPEEVIPRRHRTRQEVQQLVSEFVTSGLPRGEF